VSDKVHLPLLQYAPWSPSKAELASNCGLAFKYRYIDKIRVETKGSAAKIGTTVHRVQEHALKGETVNAALEAALKEFSHELTSVEVEKVRSFSPNVDAFKTRMDKLASKHPFKQVFIEQTWAINANFEACDYADPAAMIRGIVDLAVLLESGQLLIIDHKSGRPWPITKYLTQLDIYAIMGLAHVPALTAVQCGVHYVVNADLKWIDVRKVSYIKAVLQPWLLNMLNARATRLQGYTATTGKHCSWCDYRKSCPAKEMEDGAESKAEAADE